MRLSSKLLVGAILLASVGLRMTWIARIDPQAYPATVGVGNRDLLGWDGVIHEWAALRLLAGEGYGFKDGPPDAWKPPGYPFFLTGLYRLFGHSHLTVRRAQVVLGGLITLLVFLITRRLSASPGGGLTAAGLYALAYEPIVFTSLFYNELLASACVLAAVWAYGEVAEGGSDRVAAWRACVGGLAMAGAVLVRPETAVFVPVVVVWMAARAAYRFRVTATTLTLGLCVIVLPWTVRNYHLYQRPVFISTMGGEVFYVGAHPAAGGEYREPSQLLSEDEASSLPQDPVERDRQFYRLGWERIRRDPAGFLRLMLRKQRLLWTKPEPPGWLIGRLRGVPVPLILFYPLAVLGLLGAGLTWSARRRYGLIWGVAAAYGLMLSACFLYNGPRVRIILIPLLAVLAGAGCAEGLRRLRGSRQERPDPGR